MAEICPVCGLPKELCMCEEIAREQQTVRISIDSRRYGKTVTVIDGIDENDIDINDLGKQLKNDRSRNSKMLLFGRQVYPDFPAV